MPQAAEDDPDDPDDADDADDEAISTYLSKVSNNYKTLLQPTLGGFRQVSTGEATKEEVDNIANNLVKTL